MPAMNAFMPKVIRVAHQKLLRKDKHCTCVLIEMTTITESLPANLSYAPLVNGSQESFCFPELSIVLLLQTRS